MSNSKNIKRNISIYSQLQQDAIGRKNYRNQTLQFRHLSLRMCMKMQISRLIIYE